MLVAAIAGIGVGKAQVATTGNAVVGSGFTVTPGDLAFIMKQIKISEHHAATLTAADPCGTLVGPGPESSAHTSTTLPGCLARSRASLARRFFPPPPSGRGAGRLWVPRPGDLEGEPEVLEPLPAGLGAYGHPPPIADERRHLRSAPKPAVGRPLLEGRE